MGMRTSGAVAVGAAGWVALLWAGRTSSGPLGRIVAMRTPNERSEAGGSVSVSVSTRPVLGFLVLLESPRTAWPGGRRCAGPVRRTAKAHASADCGLDEGAA